MNEEPLNAHRITLSLFSWLRDSSDLIIPRFTPVGWWECDVWRLRDSGFTDEFEIKMSVGDFRADASKSRDRWMRGQAMDFTNQRHENKHEMIAAGKGPNRFWFVTTEEIASKVEIPDFAGMVVVNKLGRCARRRKRLRRFTATSGLAREKVLEAFYHRYWNHQFDGKPAIPFESVFDIDAEEPRETQPILPLA